jgi:predicted site-specific integrase-resolvase
MSELEKSPARSVQLLSTKKIADLNGVCVRTVERWIEAGVLPPPIRIRKRRFWPDGTMPRTDDAAARTAPEAA